MKRKFRRAFIEITNVCNLSCGFCAVSKRPAAFMAVPMFEAVARQVKPLANIVSLHVLGEPFMHPDFPEILGACSRLGLEVNLVTNGTLLDKFGPAVFNEKCLKQVSFSLHALSGLPGPERLENLRRLAEFAGAKPDGLIISFRLRGRAEDPFTREAADYILRSFPGGDAAREGSAITLRDKVFLNPGGVFDWPGRGARKEKKEGCLGLRHHFAILCTGEVIPCCVDHEGALAIGDMGKTPLADILGAPAAAALRDSIAAKTPMPEHCATCGFSAPGGSAG